MELRSFQLGRQVLLIVATGSAETGLLVLNRFLLVEGVFKFPYPIATTLVQCLITSLFVLAAERPFQTLLTLLGPPEAVSLSEDDRKTPSCRGGLRRVSPIRLLQGFSRRRFAFQKSSSQTIWQAIRKALPLATVILLKFALGNVFMIRLTALAYTLLRIGSIPLAFAFHAPFRGEWHSIMASLSALLATLSLLLAVSPLAKGTPVVDLTLGGSLSVVDALLPTVIFRTCQERCDAFPPDSEMDDPNEGRNIAAEIILRLRQGSSTFWPVLRHASLLSTILLIPLVFLTGEARHIWNDAYFLDMTCLQQLLLYSGMLNGTLLIVMSLLVMAMSPVMPSFLTAFSNAIQIGVFCKSNLLVYNWLGLAGCWFFSVCFVAAQLFAKWKGDSSTIGVAAAHNGWATLRVAMVIMMLCVGISCIARLGWDHTEAPALIEPACPVKEYLNATLSPPQNFEFIDTAHDDYLGPRPHTDTVADLSLILERCTEVAEGLGVDDVINCADFLTHESDVYLKLPAAGKGDRASEGSRGSAPSEAKVASNPSKSSTNTCLGPRFPFHVYWTGPATWRLELFIKAYLYSQNLPCSSLWIWLDSDINEHAVDRMLCDDPIFRRFLPLVSLGDLVIKAWNLPKRIPIPIDSVSDATSFHPRLQGEDFEMSIAENVIQNSAGKWLVLDSNLAHFNPVQVSDAVRFVVVHLHGGVYLDVDVILLRDMRPLLLQPHAFAEQWVERCPVPDFNTAVISMPANSSLSTYLLRGAVRMGMNFHPKAIGRMMWHDGRIKELAMLQNAIFDPLVTDLRRRGTENCTVPCHKNFEQVFKAEVEEPEREWSAYRGENTERTMDKFFRGSFAYHIHNQWQTFPEPKSWMDVITTSQDGFFQGSRTNAYGEKWKGPRIGGYDRDMWPGF